MKQTCVKFYEDNAGGIQAVVTQDNKVTNVLLGLEQEKWTADEILAEAQRAFPEAYPYDMFNHDVPMNVMAEDVQKGDLIAEIKPLVVTLYPSQMGCAGRKLFNLLEG